MILLYAALAALWAWETLRGLLPFDITPRLVPLLVVGVAFGILHLHGLWLLAPAVAGALALARKITGLTSLPPWVLPWEDIRDMIRPPRRGPGRVNPGAQGRPPPTIGKRIPRL
jgi:prepilin signal peptidase PulO-like enzyme (type II secretory pathway)